MTISPHIKIVFLLSASLFFAACNESSTDSKNEEISEQDLSNQPVYTILIGDTVRIYGMSNGGIAISTGLSVDSLNHLEFIGTEPINPEKWKNCDGCSLPFSYVLVGKSSGTDTIFDEFRDFSKPSREILTTHSHIIHVR